jgi:hypothetical protein
LRRRAGSVVVGKLWDEAVGVIDKRRRREKSKKMEGVFID